MKLKKTTIVSKHLDKLLILILFSIIIGVVGSNYYEQAKIDNSKLSEKVELSKGFQKWITNLKNKDLEIEADEFTFVEESEIYNVSSLTVYSVDNPDQYALYQAGIEKVKGAKGVAFSPNKLQYVDFRMDWKKEFKPNEIRFFGQRDDKILDSKIASCVNRPNCYFDRAYFIDDDTVVITEFSLKERLTTQQMIDKPFCGMDAECEYTIKLNVIDLANNKRAIYVSKPKLMILNDWLDKF